MELNFDSKILLWHYGSEKENVTFQDKSIIPINIQGGFKYTVFISVVLKWKFWSTKFVMTMWLTFKMILAL